MNTKIVDGHMHITQWVRYDGKSVFDCIRDYLEQNQIASIDNMCCSNRGNLWDGYEMDQSILGAVAKIENPNVFTHGCLYIPQDITQIGKYSFKDQLEELMEIGLDGVKICDFKPDAYKLLQVESLFAEYEAYIDSCEKYNVHMCWHVADPQTCWDENAVSEAFKKRGWFYGDGTYPSYDKLIAYAYELLDRHPNLHVLLAHAFFKSFDPDEVIALLEKYPNVNIDLAPGWEMFDGFRTYYEKWYDIFRTYSTRFVYATDGDMQSSGAHVNSKVEKVLRFLQTGDTFDVPAEHTAQGLQLEQDKLEDILYKNHAKAVGEKPREINKQALKKYIERYLPLMPDTKNRQMTEIYYRKNLL